MGHIHTYGYLLIIATIITVFAALTTMGVSAVEFDTAPYKNGVTITGFNGLNGGETVTIPAEIGGKPVLALGLYGVTTTTRIPGADKIGALDLITKAKNLEVIFPYAFYWCPNIKETIENKTVASVGEHAFAWCDSITSVNFPACVAVGDGAFFWTFNLKDITLQEGCSIGKGAFEVSGVNNNINYYVDWSSYFDTEPYEYNGVQGVTITEFKTKAFDENRKVTIPAEIDGKPVLALGDWLMYTSGAEHIRELDLTQATNLKIIRPYSFEDCTRLTSVIAPNITTVEDYAFENCTSLTSLNLPKVTKVGDYAFQDCTGLTSMTVKDGCNVLRKAFRNVPSTCTITYVDDKGDVVKTIKVSELSY